MEMPASYVELQILWDGSGYRYVDYWYNHTPEDTRTAFEDLRRRAEVPQGQEDYLVDLRIGGDIADTFLSDYEHLKAAGINMDLRLFKDEKYTSLGNGKCNIKLVPLPREAVKFHQAKRRKSRASN